MKLSCVACQFGLGAFLVLAAVGGEASRSTPALPPLPPSPVVFFRELLAADAEGRGRLLAGRPETQRLVLQAKLAEYETLSPGERELRLRATEFRWYLRPLLEMEPGLGAERIAALPVEHQALARERLTAWDALPPEVRRDLLEFESTLSWLHRKGVSQAAAASAEERRAPAADSTRGGEEQLARWQALPESRRAQVTEQFQAFFDLSPRRQERALSELSPEERRQIEETLRVFERMPAEQRRTCLQSFGRLARLSVEERRAFLQSADRWRELAPADREKWRQLVNRLPPLPPGFGLPPLPREPRPPSSAALATNRTW